MDAAQSPAQIDTNNEMEKEADTAGRQNSRVIPRFLQNSADRIRQTELVLRRNGIKNARKAETWKEAAAAKALEATSMEEKEPAEELGAILATLTKMSNN